MLQIMVALVIYMVLVIPMGTYLYPHNHRPENICGSCI